MKRRIATLLTLALSVTLLGGCGGSTQTSTSSKTTTNNSSGTIASSKSGTLSECLSTEKVIAYKVDTVDKSETPDNIYFFEDGKVTIIPGEEFGLTMGDFAQMDDKEIWSTYETVRATYVEEYVAEKIEDAKAPLQEELDELNSKADGTELYKEYLEKDEFYYETSSDNIDINDVLRISESGARELLTVYANISEDSVNSEDYQKLEDAINTSYQTQVPLKPSDVLSVEQMAVYISYFDEVMDDFTSQIAELQSQIDEITTCATPFCDMPFSFVVETDASGNNVQSESLVYPTLKYSIGGDAPNTFYDSLGFALGLTTQQQIYDTTYNCIALSGSGRFCTRETMETDTIDSKNVSIDLSKDEINELFKDEVMARYE